MFTLWGEQRRAFKSRAFRSTRFRTFSSGAWVKLSDLFGHSFWGEAVCVVCCRPRRRGVTLAEVEQVSDPLTDSVGVRPNLGGLGVVKSHCFLEGCFVIVGTITADNLELRGWLL